MGRDVMSRGSGFDWIVDRMTADGSVPAAARRDWTPDQARDALIRLSAELPTCSTPLHIVEAGSPEPLLLEWAQKAGARYRFLSLEAIDLRLPSRFPSARFYQGTLEGFASAATERFDWVICLAAEEGLEDDRQRRERLRLTAGLVASDGLVSVRESYSPPAPSWIRRRELLRENGLLPWKRHYLPDATCLVTSRRGG